MLTSTPNRSLLSALGTILVATSFASVARANDWGTPGLDGAHGRLSSERSGASFADGRWTSAVPGGARVLASPAAADGFVVTVDLQGSVRALRADDGQPVWQAQMGSVVQGTPAVDQGRVFIPTIGSRVVALHLADGTQIWSRDVGGMAVSSPTPVGGDVVLTAGFPSKSVVRLSGATGEIVWQTEPVMEQFGNTSPAVGGGLVVVGANGGRYYAFDVDTGAQRWSYVADGIVNLAAPIILNGRVYVAGGGDSHRVHAVDAATGTVVAGWPIDLPTPDTDVAGTRLGRHRAVSSFASVAGLLLLETRLDDALDTNGDGSVDKTLSREMVVALDPASGALAWQAARARAEIADPNDVPKFFVCPTPAAFGTDGGSALVAVSSSLEASVVVLDAAGGGERARYAVSGPALASPVMANGRLHVAAMNGAVEALFSSANHAPAAAVLASSAGPMDIGNVTLRWLPAFDADAEMPSYELRIDADGEVLENWQQQILLSPGTTSTRITGSLAAGQTYTFSVRARDARGALSPWSHPETFTVVENPTVTVGGTPAPSLAGALGSAQPGDVITLGAGIYRLTETLHVNGGLSIRGAGAGRTTLDFAGVAVGVSFDGTAAGHDTVLDGVTVKGADTCIQVSSAATGVRIVHLIAHHCRVDAIAVAAKGQVSVANTTLMDNGTGVHATGSAAIKNSLLSRNTIALAAETPGALVSQFDNLFGNQSGYKGLSAGTGDLSTGVTFANVAAYDLRLLVAQASTDEGDPADAVGEEPVPNGGRINLGAFGGTADAETSAASTVVGGAGATPPAPTASPEPPHGVSPADQGESGGCALGGRAPLGWAQLALAGIAAVLARRRRAGGRSL